MRYKGMALNWWQPGGVLKKIEELTLYMIGQNKQIDEFKKNIEDLKKYGFKSLDKPTWLSEWRPLDFQYFSSFDIWVLQ